MQGLDLTNCDREPIHIPGAIQPHGALLSLDEPELTVLQASDNVESLLGLPLEQLAGGRLDRWFSSSSLDALRNALNERVEEHSPIPFVVGGRSFDGICHRHLGATILELEPVHTAAPAVQLPLRSALAALSRHTSTAELCAAAAEATKRLTGFDRVMVYRFDEDDNGSVVAEALDAGLEPFLGLHYPASDIPRQARELYLRSYVRAIPSARYVPSQLVPSLRPDTGQPLDLSYAGLRSVSPIHLEYMRNMGVAGSMSISLIVRDKLWGLISCANHRGPRYVPYELRACSELIGRLMSLQLAALEELDARAHRLAREQPLAQLERAMRCNGRDVLEALLAEPSLLLELVDAGGAAAVTSERCVAVGAHPGEPATLALARALDTAMDAASAPDVFSSRSLSSLLPEAAHWKDSASGVLTFSLPGQPARRLLWFRPEVVQTVDWAGAPEKQVSPEPDARVHPRRSFALWKERLSLHSLPWSSGDLDVARELRRRAIEVDLAVQVEREQQAVRARDDLVAVVSHDLKNPLGVIQMQSSLLLRGVGLKDEDFSRRLRASAERIQRSVDRMNALISDLLDLGKIEAGRFEVTPTRQQPNMILDEALVVMGPLAEQKSISLKIDAAGTPDVLADRDRVYQVLSNLLGNAIKFTPEGGEVRLCTRSDAEGVVFSVVDSGAGIPPEQLQHIFNRYWQAPRTTRQGSGLGLYIARGIVEAHRGRMWVESTLGVGSRFHFVLPAVVG